MSASSPPLPVAAAVGRRYRAFISYSHTDTTWARWLMRRLESFSVPRRFLGRSAPIGAVDRRIAPIFRDRDELPTTSDLGETIRAALRESATLIVICSPASAKSRWVQEEITAFKRLRGERAVFAFIVSGEPNAAGGAEDCFSPALRSEIGADGQPSGAPAEVVAADARQQGDGPRLAFIRLVAGLLGVGFDELRQRELQRRNRRLTLVTACSVAGMGLTLGLAAMAWKARNEAVLARNDARRRQEQAEDVLSFMLGDFRADLKKVGQLDLLDRVGNKASAYFDSLDARDLTDTALARHAKALTQIGEIRMEQKDVRYAEAASTFLAAYQRARTLAERHPGNADFLFEQGQAEYWIGYVEWRRGALDLAAVWLARYRETGARLVQMEAGRPAWHGELAYGHHNLAVLDLDRGHLEAAREAFLKELAILEKLAAGAPDDLPLQFRIADVHSWLGTVAERVGDYQTALHRFREHTRIIEALQRKEPKTSRWRARLATALTMEANVLAIAGGRDDSLARQMQARALLEPLLAQDPSNRTWLRQSLRLSLKEAVVQRAEGNIPIATNLVGKALRGYERLAELEPSDRNLAAMVAMAWRMEAEVRHAAGRADAAEAALRAISIGDALMAAARANEELRGDYMLACMVAGIVARDGGDESGAQRHWAAAIAAAEPFRHKSCDWNLLDPLARVLALSGRSDESQRVIARLVRLGYTPLTPWPTVGLLSENNTRQ